jgi:hypothetical protein
VPQRVDPGAVLSKRYRLDALHASGDDGSTLWRAHDQSLSRSVAVRLLPRGHPHADAVLEAAAEAGRVSDAHLARVLDAATDRGRAYVVTEWVPGRPLSEVLAAAPLAPEDAGYLVAVLARALAFTHPAGLRHGRLHPRNVIVGCDDSIRLTDAAVAAARAGLDPAGAVERDASGLGALLYACLTARWPGGLGLVDPARAGLLPAPRVGRRLCSPRQVRAGVPALLDEVTLRALASRSGVRTAAAPLRSPAAVAEALHPLLEAELVAALGGEPAAELAASTGNAGGSDVPAAGDPVTERRWRRRLLRWGVPGAVLAGAAVAGWLAGLAIGTVPGTTNRYPALGIASAPPAASPGAAPAAPPPIVAHDFDPQGDGHENPDQAALAVDGDPSTAWFTDRYDSPSLGGLKSGVGLVLDLGEVRTVREVLVASTAAGASVQLRAAAQDADSAPTGLDGFPVVATVDEAGTTARLTPTSPVRTRYLLVWFTRLPATSGGYKEGVAEISVRS